MILFFVRFGGLGHFVLAHSYLMAIAIGDFKTPLGCHAALHTKGQAYSLDADDVQMVGHGGQGYVARVTLDHGKSYVSVKLSRSQDDEKFLLREARYLEMLNANGGHPSIVKYKELRQGPGGKFLLVSEWIAGETFYDFVRGQVFTYENLKSQFKTFLLHMTQLHEGLMFMHSRHVAHLDIKNKNLMIDKEGNLRIIDFAFASKFFTAHGKQFLSERSIGYSEDSGAPELLVRPLPNRAREVGPSADYYSMGYVMSQWLNEVKASLRVDGLDLAESRFLNKLEEFSLSLMNKNPQQRPSEEQVGLALRAFQESLDKL